MAFEVQYEAQMRILHTTISDIQYVFNIFMQKLFLNISIFAIYAIYDYDNDIFMH